MRSCSDTCGAGGRAERAFLRLHCGEEKRTEGRDEWEIRKQRDGERLPSIFPEVSIVSRVLSDFLGQGLMKDAFHYYQEGYNLCGREAGENAARAFTL